MLTADFEALFERSRCRALRFPRLYRLGVTARAALGVGCVLGLGAFAIYGLGWALSPFYDGGFATAPWHSVLQLQLAVPALASLACVARVLRGRFPPPEGIVLGRDEAPAMFALLDRMRRRFGTPPIHEVRITGDLNAAITQRPSAVHLGTLRNTLVLGLPLAFSLTPRQFVAVLAHEFGHLRRQRIALGGWGCHLRALWHQVLDNMENTPSRLQPLFAAIARAESPVYCAESLVLSHLDELEADETAAEVVGARLLGQALTEVALKHRFLAQDFWRKVYAQADRAKQPSILPYRHMAAALKVGFDREQATDWFEELAGAAGEETPLGTHPSLSVRVRALGLDAPEPGRGGERAAERFLGPALGRLTGMLDRNWWDAEQRSWRQRHWEVSRALQRIARLEAEGQLLGVSDRLELALLVERYAGDRDPLAVYRDVMPQAPGRPDALLAMGRLLLNRNDPSGVAYLRRALSEDDAVGLQATALLIEHYESCGIAAAAAPYRKRLAVLLRQAGAVQATLDAPIEEVRCLQPGLERHELRALVRELRRHPVIRSGYVVRRRNDDAPSWRAYLVLICTAPEDADIGQAIAAELVSGIALCGLWRCVATVEGSAEEVALARVRGAKFFSRRKHPAAAETLQ